MKKDLIELIEILKYYFNDLIIETDLNSIDVKPRSLDGLNKIGGIDLQKVIHTNVGNGSEVLDNEYSLFN